MPTPVPPTPTGPDRRPAGDRRRPPRQLARAAPDVRLDAGLAGRAVGGSHAPPAARWIPAPGGAHAPEPTRSSGSRAGSRAARRVLAPNGKTPHRRDGLDGARRAGTRPFTTARGHQGGGVASAAAAPRGEAGASRRRPRPLRGRRVRAGAVVERSGRARLLPTCFATRSTATARWTSSPRWAELVARAERRRSYQRRRPLARLCREGDHAHPTRYFGVEDDAPRPELQHAPTPSTAAYAHARLRDVATSPPRRYPAQLRPAPPEPEWSQRRGLRGIAAPVTPPPRRVAPSRAAAARPLPSTTPRRPRCARARRALDDVAAGMDGVAPAFGRPRRSKRGSPTDPVAGTPPAQTRSCAPHARGPRLDVFGVLKRPTADGRDVPGSGRRLGGLARKCGERPARAPRSRARLRMKYAGVEAARLRWRDLEDGLDAALGAARTLRPADYTALPRCASAGPPRPGEEYGGDVRHVVCTTGVRRLRRDMTLCASWRPRPRPVRTWAPEAGARGSPATGSVTALTGRGARRAGRPPARPAWRSRRARDAAPSSSAVVRLIAVRCRRAAAARPRRPRGVFGSARARRRRGLLAAASADELSPSRSHSALPRPRGGRRASVPLPADRRARAARASDRADRRWWRPTHANEQTT